MNWQEMTAWDRNGAVAVQLMGWTTRIDPVHGVTYWIDPGGHEHLEPMRYTTSPISVLLVEDEIERRGLQNAYARCLFAIVTNTPSGDSAVYDIVAYGEGTVEAPDLWLLLRANPDQRCQAALRALEES